MFLLNNYSKCQGNDIICNNNRSQAIERNSKHRCSIIIIMIMIIIMIIIIMIIKSLFKEKAQLGNPNLP